MVILRSKQTFGVELDGFYRECAVPDSHDDSIFGFGRDFETRREFVALRIEAVIAAHFKRAGQAREDAFPGVMDFAWFSMNGVIKNCQFAAKGFYNSLQAQADAEDGDVLFHGFMY